MSNTQMHLPTDLVSIKVGRFEQSPYFDFYNNPDTILGVAAGRFYAAYNGEDPVAIYWALRQEAVLFDVPEKPWQIEGPDAVAYLEKIFARRIGSLPIGRGRYAIACTAEGGAFMDGILFRLAENCFWYVQPDGAFEEWMIAHRQGFKVQISDPQSRVLQIQGPNAMKIMAVATGGAIDESMKYFHSGFYDIGGQQLYVSRTGWTGELGYEIYSQGTQTDYPKLWHHLFDAGTPYGMCFGSLTAMGTRRIEAGIMDNMSDFDTTMTPFEVGLGLFIELDKVGFIGHHALLKANQQSLMYGIKCTASRPHVNAEIWFNSELVGHVTASSWSPYLECGIGFVRFQQARNWAGTSVQMTLKEGGYDTCEIVPLPFYDVEKHIPRALN